MKLLTDFESKLIQQERERDQKALRLFSIDSEILWYR